jgi:hypothetical protein
MVRFRRRQKRRSDAVNRAIDEAIEQLYVATGLNTNGKRGGRLKKRGRERDADVLVAIGNPTFGNVRGRAPAAPKALVTTLAKRYRTFTLSERNTSKLCDECGSELVKTRGHSVRYWRCPCAGGGMIDGRDGKRRHEKEQNKDIIASRSILIILLTLLTTGIRPKAWSDDDDDATKRDDDDGGDDGDDAGDGTKKKKKKKANTRQIASTPKQVHRRTTTMMMMMVHRRRRRGPNW